MIIQWFDTEEVRRALGEVDVWPDEVGDNGWAYIDTCCSNIIQVKPGDWVIAKDDGWLFSGEGSKCNQRFFAALDLSSAMNLDEELNRGGSAWVKKYGWYAKLEHIPRDGVLVEQPSVSG